MAFNLSATPFQALTVLCTHSIVAVKGLPCSLLNDFFVLGLVKHQVDQARSTGCRYLSTGGTMIMKMAMEQKERKNGAKKEENVITAPSQGGPKDLIIRHL